MSKDTSPEDTQASEISDETWNQMRQLWAEMRTEFDKSILLAASAGVGLCVMTLLDRPNPNLIWPFFLALIAFSISVGSILFVFKHNANYLQKLMNDPRAPNKNPLLSFFDTVALTTFIVATIFVFIAVYIHIFI